MAAKKTRGKSARKGKMPMKKSAARVTKKKSARVAKPAKRGPQKAAKKAAPRKAAPKKAAKKAPAKKAPVRKRTPVSSESANTLSRVARVAKEIAHQTTVAVTEGIDKAKEVGGSIVDRVTG
jgi:hypothetical protein